MVKRFIRKCIDTFIDCIYFIIDIYEKCTDFIGEKFYDVLIVVLIILFIIYSLASAFWILCGSPDNEIGAFVKGMEYAIDGDSEKACEEFDKIFNNPDDADYEQASKDYADGNYENCIRLLLNLKEKGYTIDNSILEDAICKYASELVKNKVD